jgi:hypothetical protein
MHPRFLQLLAALCLFGFLLLQPSGTLHAQQRSQRLIMKDGSYQPVSQYEVQGDRVHYLSAERYEWEDVPNSLVDWNATNKYNTALKSAKTALRLEESPEEKEEREKEEANSPEVAPGLHLPGSGGVFLLDQYEGKAEAAEILQNGSELNADKKKSVLRSAINPMAGSKQSFELKGEHAQIQSHLPRPSIYIDIDAGTSNDSASSERYRLVRAETRKDKRVVGNLKVSLSGKTTEQNIFVPAKVEPVGKGAWLKLTPQQDLAPGEYAVVEMLNPQEMNTYVWDFGVNPKAPANPNTWRPVPSQSKTQPN